MYFFIDQKPIFITDKEQKKHRNILADNERDILKKTRYLIGGFAGSIEASEIEQLIFEKLSEIKNKNFEYFEKNYYNFDLNSEEAQINIWNLFYDYCHYYGCGSLSDARSFEDKFIADHEGESPLYPMGKIFFLNYLIQTSKRWWKFTSEMKSRRISVLINIEEIVRIKGSLNNFTIYTEKIKLVCGENLEIYTN